MVTQQVCEIAIPKIAHPIYGIGFLNYYYDNIK